AALDDVRIGAAACAWRWRCLLSIVGRRRTAATTACGTTAGHVDYLAGVENVWIERRIGIQELLRRDAALARNGIEPFAGLYGVGIRARAAAARAAVCGGGLLDGWRLIVFARRCGSGQQGRLDDDGRYFGTGRFGGRRRFGRLIRRRYESRVINGGFGARRWSRLCFIACGDECIVGEWNEGGSRNLGLALGAGGRADDQESEGKIDNALGTKRFHRSFSLVDSPEPLRFQPDDAAGLHRALYHKQGTASR